MKNLIRNKVSMIAMGIIAALLVTGAGMYIYLKAPSNLVALDVNPSIEIHTNRLNEVTAVTPINGDAAKLLADYQFQDSSLQSVIDEIVSRLVTNGYLVPGQDNKILVTVDNGNPTQTLMTNINSIIKSYLKDNQIDADVLQQTMKVSKAEKEQAHNNKVSVGKMSVINKIKDNSDLTTKELASTSIRNLIKYAINHNISLDDIILNYNAVTGTTSTTDTTGTTSTTGTTPATGTTTAAETTPAPVDAVSSATTKTTDSNVSGNDSGSTVKKDGKEADENDADKISDKSKAKIKIVVVSKEDKGNQNEADDQEDANKKHEVKKKDVNHVKNKDIEKADNEDNDSQDEQSDDDHDKTANHQNADQSKHNQIMDNYNRAGKEYNEDSQDNEDQGNHDNGKENSGNHEDNNHGDENDD